MCLYKYDVMIYDVYITVSIYIQTYGERYIQQSPSGKEKNDKTSVI